MERECLRGARFVIARTNTKKYTETLQQRAAPKHRDPRSSEVGTVIFLESLRF